MQKWSSYSAVQRLLEWHRHIMWLVIAVSAITITVLAIHYMMSESESEQAHAIKRIKHSLVFVAIACSMAGTISYVFGKFGF